MFFILPECQVEGHVDSPQAAGGCVDQAHLLCLGLPALAGHVVQTHDLVAGVQ